ncbi:MAG: hypothetical protein M3Q65_19310 [Chloroflexota bacterium]|nr:hypothetical protein [Chloroflexota bacterium]
MGEERWDESALDILIRRALRRYRLPPDFAQRVAQAIQAAQQERRDASLTDGAGRAKRRSPARRWGGRRA